MSLEKPRILIVDDEIDICTCLQGYFERRDFIVSTTGNGLEALSMLRVSKYDLVLLDLTLPGLNGGKVLEGLRANDKETKVIIVSGNDDAKEIARLYSLGIEGYCSKPLMLENLLAAVYKAIGMPGV
ncbi:MAG: response regulator [Candidatus Omnitrophica bacterium]|nr:response regulator [Candidatus Omnitrophota bacterium]